MSLAVSLCVLRIETSDESYKLGLDLDSVKDNTDECGAMAADEDKTRFARGRRGNHDITIETYTREDGEKRPIGILSGTKAQAVPVPVEPQARRSCEPDSLVEVSDTLSKPKDQISFISGNPFVEVTKGILHLFKEDELTHMDRAVQRSQTVCILAVPATMTCHDLLTFTAACHGDIQHLRIIRDGAPNQYMALLTFRTQQSASEFYTSFNGAPFNSLDPTCCCHLVFVSRVEVSEGDGGMYPPPGHTELPTCPVCLERMDESVDGILTILCNHAFHGSCLAKWGDTSCPVCRYVQTPELVEDNRCFECHSADGLWICLICGHVGCGRYVQGHASEHYLTTQHCYSMQLGSNRVWDYVGDNFVHRLLQNKGDGKLVEGSGLAKQECEEKLDSVQLEFTYLLTSQLDSQRQYFEDQMVRVETSSITEAAALREKVIQAAEENQALQRKLATLAREKIATDKKLQHMTTRLATVLSDLQDERQMSKAFQQNQSAWQTKFTALETTFQEYKTAKDKELNEVKDQLRDVMFSLEAQRQIWNSADRVEISEGRITVGEPAPAPSNSRGHRRRKR